MSLGFQVVAATAAEWPLLRAGKGHGVCKGCSQRLLPQSLPLYQLAQVSPMEGSLPGVGGRVAQQPVGGKLSLLFSCTWSFLAKGGAITPSPWQAPVAIREPAAGSGKELCLNVLLLAGFIGQHSVREGVWVRPSSPGGRGEA